MQLTQNTQASWLSVQLSNTEHKLLWLQETMRSDCTKTKSRRGLHSVIHINCRGTVRWSGAVSACFLPSGTKNWHPARRLPSAAPPKEPEGNINTAPSGLSQGRCFSFPNLYLSIVSVKPFIIFSGAAFSIRSNYRTLTRDKKQDLSKHFSTSKNKKGDINKTEAACSVSKVGNKEAEQLM